MQSSPPTTALSPWLLLHQLPQVGSITQAKLIAHCGSAAGVFDTPPEKLSALLRRPALQALLDYQRRGCCSDLAIQFEMTLDRLKACGAWFVTPDDEDYPALLLEISDAPAVLFGRGERSALCLPQIAVVGSRQSSRQACANAYHFSHYLAQAGFVITSGLAKGIDAASHQGCLQAGGLTVAVLGCGVDIVYPAQNRSIFEEIISTGGAVISEYGPGTSPKPGHFPKRNRIISGMSMGVLVVEAALKSGSLITARSALEQNREVFALPGSVHNPLSKGCHQLIREGATLVESAADIVTELGALLGAVSETCATGSETEEASIQNDDPLLRAMGYEVVSIDTLVALLNWDASQVAAQLLTLEVEGFVELVPGGYQRLVDAKS